MQTLRQQIEHYEPFNEQEESDRRLILRYMDIFPDLLTRENEMAHFTASCWIANHDQTKVLMAYHNLYRSWAWLGGHADGEEDLLQVALREANEESGITGIRPQTKDIFSLEILGVDAHRKRGRHVSSHLHLNVTYFFYADDTLPLRVKPDENSAVRWIETGHVMDEVSEPEMRVVYQKLMEKMWLYY